MDSVTQAALGAAIGGAVMGRRLGRKSLLICIERYIIYTFITLVFHE